MLAPEDVFNALRGEGIRFYTGVPDSLLKHFCAYVTDQAGEGEHIIAANEGGAVALAAGHYLATGQPALVYLQNSGLGNAVNPLLSLGDREVYSIPMLLMIGWRGEPGQKDEPQHIKQGRITPALLDVMEIPYSVMGSDTSDINQLVVSACAVMRRDATPCALLVRNGTFTPYQSAGAAFADPPDPGPGFNPLSREEAIRAIVDELGEDDVVVSTTGMASRELFEYREAKGQGHGRDFLTVGSMGHASQIALGIASKRPERRVICLDGDGATLMHMGALAIIGQHAPANFVHIVLNNGAHDSVGGQPTVAHEIDLTGVARACAYRRAVKLSDAREIRQALSAAGSRSGPIMLEIAVSKGARKDLGRPTLTPRQNRDAFMDHLVSGRGAPRSKAE